jgi:hypothetical protein
VAELVDALASGASGLTAVKVRVLSWAPFLPKPMISLKGGFFDPLTGTQNRDTARMSYRMSHIYQDSDSSQHMQMLVQSCAALGFPGPEAGEGEVSVSGELGELVAPSDPSLDALLW